MASEVQIGKMALSFVGDEFDITDLDEETVVAEQVNLHFVDTRNEMLRRYPWRFAKKYTSPATLTGTVPGNWDYMYTYITDAIWIRGIVDPLKGKVPIKFEIARNSVNVKVILTDQDTAEFFYTQRVTNPADFDPEFVIAFSYALSARMAMSLTGDGGIAQSLDLLARQKAMEAQVTDGNEGVEQEKPEASWITARD
jgi:hypothetical protein